MKVGDRRYWQIICDAMGLRSRAYQCMACGRPTRELMCLSCHRECDERVRAKQAAPLPEPPEADDAA